MIEQKNILVLDDVNTAVVTHFLKHHHCHEASTLEEAMNILAEQQIDVLIADYDLPEGTGADLIRYVNREFSSIRTIMITGYLMEELKQVAEDINADAFLFKPVSREELVALIDN